MRQRSSTQRLADVLLGVPLEDFIRDRRAAERSWRLVARDIYEATGGEIDVTPYTVQRWVAEAPVPAA